MRRRTDFDHDKWVDEVLRRRCGVVSCRLVQRRRFRGFDGFKPRAFLQLKFRNRGDLRRVVKACYERRRDGNPEPIPGAPPLYESDLDPLLDLFQTCDVRSCGWVVAEDAAPGFTAPQRAGEGVSAHTVRYDDLRSPTAEESRALPVIGRLKTLFFDIECASEHGDFLVPCKTFLRRRTRSWTWWAACPRRRALACVRRRIGRAFDRPTSTGASCSRPRRDRPSEADLDACARDVAHAGLRGRGGGDGAGGSSACAAGTAPRWPSAWTCA